VLILNKLLEILDKSCKEQNAVQEKNFAIYDKYYSPEVVIPKRLKLYEKLIKNK